MKKTVFAFMVITQASMEEDTLTALLTGQWDEVFMRKYRAVQEWVGKSASQEPFLCISCPTELRISAGEPSAIAMFWDEGNPDQPMGTFAICQSCYRSMNGKTAAEGMLYLRDCMRKILPDGEMHVISESATVQ